MPDTLSVQRPHAGVVVLTLNRPERLNAIDEATADALRAALGALGADRAVNAVILTGAGRGFCSGIDMRDFGPGMLEATAPAVDRLRFQEMMALLPRHLRIAATGDRRGERSVRRGRPGIVPGRDIRICSTPRLSAMRRSTSGCPGPKWE